MIVLTLEPTGWIAVSNDPRCQAPRFLHPVVPASCWYNTRDGPSVS
jgi:hypothetical protein